MSINLKTERFRNIEQIGYYVYWRLGILYIELPTQCRTLLFSCLLWFLFVPLLFFFYYAFYLYVFSLLCLLSVS